MAYKLIDLVDQLDPNTESLVSETRRQVGPLVRRALREETRLQLVTRSERDEDWDVKSVRVLVSPGLPAPLRDIEFPDSQVVALQLAPLSSDLQAALDRLRELEVPLISLSTQSDFRSKFEDANEVVGRARDLLAALLEEANRAQVLKRIFAIHEDVLGAYFFPDDEQEEIYLNERLPKTHVELYWVVIGLIAKFLGVSVAALTVKVLAHELAHAFTHVGVDANGGHWHTAEFARLDVSLREGLAQYYTARVLDRLSGRFPEAQTAYQKLLPHQSPPYHRHLAWVEDYSPEEVREAMREARRRGIHLSDDFDQLLLAAKERGAA